MVIPESTEAAIDDANLALEALSCMLDSMASLNVKLHQAGQSTAFVELPPDCLSAVLRMVSEKIAVCRNNPSLNALRRVRPDLFHHQGA